MIHDDLSIHFVDHFFFFLHKYEMYIYFIYEYKKIMIFIKYTMKTYNVIVIQKAH